MRRLSPRRALVALGLSLVTLVAGAPPAEASYQPNHSLRAGQRPRPGASMWVPQSVDFKSGWDSVNRNVWFTIGFEWYAGNPRKMQDTIGSQQFFEIDAEVPCSWARVVDSSQNLAGNEGYGVWFDSNVPNGALPFNDSTFGEACRSGNSGRGKFGVGVLNPSALTTGHYYISVALSNAGWISSPPNGAVSLSIGGGTAYDSSNSVPTELQADCFFSDSPDIAGWKDDTSGALNRRLEASWCAWQDWNHIVTRDDDGRLNTGAIDGFGAPLTQLFWTNRLVNQGFEEPTAATGTYLNTLGTGYSTQPSAFKARICAPGAGFDGNCYTQFNRGTGYWASVYQDVYWGNWQKPFTAEAAVRCPVSNPGSCSVGVGFRSIRNVNDHDFTWTWVPDDGNWYICRVDWDHVDQGGSPGLTNADDSIQFEVINSTGDNLDIDFAFLGGKTLRNDPSPNGLPTDVGDISAGPNCTQR